MQDSLTTHTATVPEVFNGLLSMYLPNLKSVALPVPEIIGGTPQKTGETLDTPTVPFLEIFSSQYRAMHIVHRAVKIN